MRATEDDGAHRRFAAACTVALDERDEIRARAVLHAGLVVLHGLREADAAAVRDLVARDAARVELGA